MVTITMLESSSIGSKFYRKGNSYEVDDEIAYALGPSCKMMGQTVTPPAPVKAKAVKAPKKDKMVKTPPVDKTV